MANKNLKTLLENAPKDLRDVLGGDTDVAVDRLTNFLKSIGVNVDDVIKITLHNGAPIKKEVVKTKDSKEYSFVKHVELVSPLPLKGSAEDAKKANNLVCNHLDKHMGPLYEGTFGENPLYTIRFVFGDDIAIEFKWDNDIKTFVTISGTRKYSYDQPTRGFQEVGNEKETSLSGMNDVSVEAGMGSSKDVNEQGPSEEKPDGGYAGKPDGDDGAVDGYYESGVSAAMHKGNAGEWLREYFAHGGALTSLDKIQIRERIEKVILEKNYDLLEENDVIQGIRISPDDFIGDEFDINSLPIKTFITSVIKELGFSQVTFRKFNNNAFTVDCRL